jgi:hypothetical protein
MRRAGDGASVVQVLSGTTSLSTVVVKTTNFATTRFLLKVVTAGTALKAWVNGELVADVNNVPNPTGGGHTFVDGRVDPNNPGRVRLKYFITRAPTDGLVDVAFDKKDRCYLTIVQEGMWSSFQPSTFFFSLGGFRMDFNTFWTNVFAFLPGLWQQVGVGVEHHAMVLKVSFAHGTSAKLEYKADSELEYVPH